jgi:transposase
MRAHLAEFGIVAAQGRRKVKDLITGLDNAEVPELARVALWQIADQIDECDKRVDALERRMLARRRTDEASRNLATIPGIGPITASRLRPRSPIRLLSGTAAN